MKEKVKTNIYLDIEKSILPLFEEMHFYLVDMDITGGKNRHIVIYVYGDSTGTDELERLSRNIYPVLENLDALKTGFSLELSTPGIFRNFKYAAEFNIFRGRQVKLVFGDGSESIGTLNSLSGDNVEIVCNGQTGVFELGKIKTAKLNG